MIWIKNKKGQALWMRPGTAIEVQNDDEGKLFHVVVEGNIFASGESEEAATKEVDKITTECIRITTDEGGVGTVVIDDF